MLDSIKKIWQDYACLLVYTALSCLAVSDTGYYFYMADYVGSHALLLRHLCLILLGIKVLGTRYTKKEFLILAAAAIPALYNYTVCQNATFIYSILVIAALKNVNLNTVFRVLFFATSASLLAFAVMSLYGIGDVVSITMDFGRGGIETRYCWGMHHPNIWHFAFARVIVYFVLGFKKHMKWYSYLLLFLINYIAYRFTVSRTGFLATSVFLLLMAAYRYLKKLMHSLPVNIAIITGIAAIYTLFLWCMKLLMTGASPFAEFVNNRITTGRISLAANYLSQHPIRFWGSDFWYGTVFDCGFLRLFYDCGYLLGGIFFLAFFLLLFYAMKHKKGTVISVCIFMVLYSIYEIDPITRPTFNIVIFFLAALLYKDSYAKKNRTSSDTDKQTL